MVFLIKKRQDKQDRKKYARRPIGVTLLKYVMGIVSNKEKTKLPCLLHLINIFLVLTTTYKVMQFYLHKYISEVTLINSLNCEIVKQISI